MDLTADALMSRAAHELVSKADELIADVKRCLRGEAPELWDAPDLARCPAERQGKRR